MHEKKDSFYFCCAEKDSLYAAMDVGAIWLERALSSK